jgi:SAM-dependent methyltransferase
MTKKIIFTEQVKKVLEKPNSEAFYCPFCKRVTISPKNIKSGITMCTMCASFERHRFLYFVYEKYIFSEANKRPIKILHFAPEKSLYDKISGNSNIDYICCDLEPKNFPFVKKIQKEDGLNLSFENETFDFVIHNHVIEHVPNDKKFILENLRVLKKTGKLIISFPFEPNRLSHFDDSITDPKERLKYFGLEDHLRLYGNDFLDKLKDDRWDIEIIDKDKILTKTEQRYMKVNVENGADRIEILDPLDVFAIISKK